MSMNLEPIRLEEATEYYIFNSTLGAIATLKADFDYLRDEQEKWEAENKPPSPPKIPLTPNHPTKWVLKLARKAHKLSKSQRIPIKNAELMVAAEHGDIDDEDDPDYLMKMKIWEMLKFAYIEKILYYQNVLYETTKGYYTLEQIQTINNEDLVNNYLECKTFETIKKIAKTQERYDFFNHFVKTSVITWEAVLAAGKRLGIKRYGVNILEIEHGGGGESQNLYGIGVIAASDVGVTPHEFREMSISEQAGIIATDLIKKWQKYYAQLEAQRDAQMRAQHG